MHIFWWSLVNIFIIYLKESPGIILTTLNWVDKIEYLEGSLKIAYLPEIKDDVDSTDIFYIILCSVIFLFFLVKTNDAYPFERMIILLLSPVFIIKLSG